MAQTVQQRFGFDDKDMKTPKHDEIMLWLDRNIRQILNPFVEKHRTTPEQDVEECFNHYLEDRLSSYGDKYQEEAIGKIRDAYLPVDLAKFKTDIQYGVTWEVPIKNGNFIVGFVDMRVVAKIFYPVPHVDLQEGRYTWKWSQSFFQYQYFLEVKSTIPSLGELIRQVRMYQSYDNHGDRPTYIIVCPDTRFADAIRSQGIEFVEYVPQGQMI